MKLYHILIVLCLMTACTSTRETTLSNTTSNQAKAEPATGVTYAKLTFEADQKDYLPQLLGPWVMHTMQRQARLPEETLNISLQLNDDKTYTASTTCGDIKGNYTVKGVSIRFTQEGYDRTNCVNTEKVDEMIRLLTGTVSMYTVNGNMLFLKDNSSNNIFRITR